MSTADKAADTLWVIRGAIEALKEKLNLASTAEQDFVSCLGAIGELAERLNTGRLSD